MGVRPKILVVTGLGVGDGAGVVAPGMGVIVGVQVGLGVPPPPGQPFEQVKPEFMPGIVGMGVGVERAGGTAVSGGTTCTVKDVLPDWFISKKGTVHVSTRVLSKYSGRIT